MRSLTLTGDDCVTFDRLLYIWTACRSLSTAVVTIAAPCVGCKSAQVSLMTIPPKSPGYFEMYWVVNGAGVALSVSCHEISCMSIKPRIGIFGGTSVTVPGTDGDG